MNLKPDQLIPVKPGFNADEAMTKVLAMTAKELRIFIAEYLFPQYPVFESESGLRHRYAEGKHGPVSGYAVSLDDMEYAEKTFDVSIQSGNSPRYIYSRWVYKVTELDPNRQPFRATARQRAQAFVLTVMEMRSYEQQRNQVIHSNQLDNNSSQGLAQE